MSTSAPAITINTPFTFDESLFNGFDYTIEPIDYLRYGIGKRIDSADYNKSVRFTEYNDYLSANCSDVNVKVIALNHITTAPHVISEFITFQVTINRYTITPKESLTAEQEWLFSTNLTSKLQSTDDHALLAFFIEKPYVSVKRDTMSIVLNDTHISLPDITINVDRFISNDDELKLLKYVDSVSAFYRERYNETVKMLIDN